MTPKNIEVDGKGLLVRSDNPIPEFKKIVGASYDRKEKVWRFPVVALPKVINRFPNYQVTPEARNIYSKYAQRHNVIENLKSGRQNPTPDTFLMKHQRLCRDIAKMTDRYAFFLDTGTGKTIVALSIIQDNLTTRWAIVCPKAIIKNAWMSDHLKYYPDLHLLPVSKNMKREDYFSLAKRWGILLDKRTPLDKCIEKLVEYAQVYIVNPESFKNWRDKFLAWGVTGLIFDESVLISNPSAQITQEIIKFSDYMDKVYLLSGEPAPNNEQQYFSQMRVIEKGLFGDSFYRFRAAFFEPVDYMGYKWELKPSMREKFYKLLNSKSVFVDKHDCLDLPSITHLTRSIELTGEALRYYKSMEKERFLQVGDSVTIAANILTNIMKLRQITSGFIIDSTEEEQMLHKQKLNELLHVLDEIGNHQVIIWCNFKNELRTIEATLKEKGKTVVTAFSETKNVDEAARQFKDGEVQYMVAHPKTLKYGLTFTKCTYAIYYSISYSYDDLKQSHDRIYRKGQDKPCTFIFLLAENTIDEVIYNSLNEKKDMSECIRQYMKGRGL